ncbi:MAG: TIGR04282 family arsenosugar biosynthesis glycosyltransferase [Leptospira sp.]|nr:TIGR04282 family arsenosugar biosynthesis glycosyltransferase [Leptospira sp.]
MEKQTLIIFAKNPRLGHVKTRIAKEVGDAQALQIYRSLLSRILEISEHFVTNNVIYWEGGIPEGDFYIKKSFSNENQVIGDLGYKMEKAFEQELKDSEYVCIIGSDCIELTKEIVEEAFASLSQHDFVIGPAHDGGYYLLGMKHASPYIFEGIEWSTDQVYKETLQSIKNQSKSVYVLPMLGDVDTYSDYLIMKDKGLIL